MIVVLFVVCAYLAYLLGRVQGHRAGVELGRSRSDAEWAVWVEHGAV